MTAEYYAQGIVIGLLGVLLMAGAFWWGYQVRAKLAEKLEFWNVTNRQWHEYDEYHRRKGKPPKKGSVLYLQNGTDDE